MADLGAIGFCRRAPASHVRGGVISGVVTAANGTPAAGRMVTVLDRTTYKQGSVPTFERTMTRTDGAYSVAGLDTSFSAGPRQYAVLCFDDTAGFNGLVLDKVVPA